jgi:propionyl-CoA carboxylase beta chain
MNINLKDHISDTKNIQDIFINNNNKFFSNKQKSEINEDSFYENSMAYSNILSDNELSEFMTKDFIINKSNGKQNEKGKLNSVDRIKILANFDLENNFIEILKFITHQCFNFDMQKRKSIGDGVITGKIRFDNKREVFIAAQDFLVNGGSVGYSHGSKIAKTLKMAIDEKKPFIFMNDSGGARIQEGVDSLGGYGEIFHLNVAAQNKIPQISIIMGPCAGGAVYSPALTDFVFMVKDTSYMYLTGPNIVKKVTFEDVSHETLGGSSVHLYKSGVADLAFENDIDALNNAKILLSYIPDNSESNPPHNFNYVNDISFQDNEYLNYFMPKSSNEAYDMKNIINEIVDNGSFFELKKHFAENIIIGFARIGGLVTGIIANQPLFLAGCLDIDSSLKAEKFIRFCDSFNIPIISLVDVPGFLPGTQQEYSGIINHGSKLLYAYSNAKVPKITVILRKAYGGAYIVMNSKHIGSNINFSWPNTEIAVMGHEGAAELLVKEKNNENYTKFFKEYKNISGPEYAARAGFIDDIIEPSKTRKILYKSLLSLIKKKDCANIMHNNFKSNYVYHD